STNEFQSLGLDDTTNLLTISEDPTTTPVDLSAYLDDQNAGEVAYDNSTSGLVSDNTQEAIDELVVRIAADGDTDSTNEFQSLGLDATTNLLTISDDPTTTPVDLSAYLDDQNAGEVAYDNSTSGLVSDNTQEAIDELVVSIAADGDTDSTNEFQSLG